VTSTNRSASTKNVEQIEHPVTPGDLLSSLLSGQDFAARAAVPVSFIIFFENRDSGSDEGPKFSPGITNHSTLQK
jgi:hypothetical protein